MNRLQVELRRLFGVGEGAPGGADGRVAVLELARPADWATLAAVWRGVQSDLGLPAPAIEINGVDGYRLWFALDEPVPAGALTAFLDGLRRRYLGDIAPVRVALLVVVDAAMAPPRQLAADRWSAFVAPDLAPVFADEPWLDTPPGIDGQADLLLRHTAINAIDWRVALERLDAVAPRSEAAATAEPGADLDPRRFLLGVMNDASVALPLRIEAAKALLLAEPQRR